MTPWPRGARHAQRNLYGRTWQHARTAALGPELAATSLARRPYDLRHAALSLWLTATSSPADIAARAGNSPRILHDTYTHAIHGHDHTVNQQIEQALQAPSPPVTGGGTPDRCHTQFRPSCVREEQHRPARGPRSHHPGRHQHSSHASQRVTDQSSSVT